MNPKKIFALIFTIFIIQQVSFSQNNPIIKYLPPNTSMIISFNPLSLAGKIPVEDFRQSYIYRELAKKDSGTLKIFFSDLFQTGIDFSGGLMIANVTDTAQGHPIPTYHVFGSLKNEPLFSKTVQKQIKGDETIQVYGTNKILFSKNADPILAWNNEVFVFIYGNSLKNLMSAQVVAYNDSVVYDTTAEKYKEENFEKERKLEEEKFRKEQRNYCFELLTPKNNNPFFSNNYFIDLMKENGDITIWNNGMNPGIGRYLGLAPKQAKGLLSKLQSLRGHTKTSIINFENGKITATNRNYPDEQVADIYQKYPSPVLNTELARHLPKGELLGLMMGSVNTDMAKEIIHANGINEILDSIKEKIPFDFNLLRAAFKNEMLLAVLKNEADDKNTAPGKFGGIELILAIPIADKEKFEELKTVASRLIDSLKDTEKGNKSFKDFKPVIKYNDDLFVLALSEKTATDFLNNTGSGTDPEWLQAYTSYPMVMELNMKELIGMAFTKKGAAATAQDQEMAKKIKDIFDKLIIAGGSYKNGSLNGVTEFRFGNSNENALKQLFDFVNMAAEENEHVKNEQQKNFEKEMIIENNKEEKLPPPPPNPPKKVKMQPVKKGNGL